jgi:sulfoxide reductase heme-binding subunit YedZ
MLGPWNVLRRRPTPVSYDLRRDVGIVAGILALVHTGIGLTVHLRGRMWMYFFKAVHPLRLQATAFGAANYIGLIAAALFAMLLALSNDWSLRALGTPRWKSLQRWTYAALVLTLVHSILFQYVEKRRVPWILFFVTTALATLVVQSLGYLQKRGHTKSR